VKEVAPDLIDRALRAASRPYADDEPPPEFDQICLKVVEGLRRDAPAYRPLARALESAGPGVLDRFALQMSLAPLVRATLPKLPIWARALSNDHAASIRLAFRDATAVKEDAGPAFMEMLDAHLEEPWQVLRLISLVMDRPSDRYLASSELAFFGERLLDDLDRRIEILRDFNPDRGLEGGVEAAAHVQAVAHLTAEFEQWLNIARDGPWGRRLMAQRRNLALVVEIRLREVEPAVNAALPVQSIRHAARTIRGAPDLSRALEPRAVHKAQALLGFLSETRVVASTAGFGATRAKVVEALDARIDQYVEDLLERLHAAEEEPEPIRAALDVAAEFLGLVREPGSAEIVRRRAAVA